MLQRILTILIPLLLPLFLYILYKVYVKMWRQTHPAETFFDVTDLKVFPFLFFAGIVLMIIVLAMLTIFGGSDPSGTYVPPRYENNQLIPSEIQKNTDKDTGRDR